MPGPVDCGAATTKVFPNKNTTKNSDDAKCDFFMMSDFVWKHGDRSEKLHMTVWAI